MTFSGITTTLSNNAKQMNMLVQNISTNMKTTFGPVVSNLNDSIDVLKAGGDVVSAVVKDVTGENVTIRSIQKGASDFDSKWDAFAKEVNEKFANTSQSNQANIMKTFAKSHFGNDVYNVGSAIKNELPGVLDGITDYKETIDRLKTNSKTAEETATKIKKGVDTIVKATEKVAGSLNNAITICTGNGYSVLDTLSRIGGTPSIANLNKVLKIGVSGATTATAANQLKESLKNKDLRGVTDAMAKGAMSVNDLLTQLQSISPKFPNVQIPVQITNSIQRLKDGQAVYDAAGSMLTALVADASGQVTISSLATLTSNFNKNWDTFSSKIDALFHITPENGQQAVLETVAKTMFSQNVYNAGSAIKRQLPGVLTGVAGVQDAFKQFGGSYRNPIEAVKKIRNGVEKMVQSIEQISQSLNEMAKTWHGNGQGYPLLDALGNLSGTKGVKILDTVLRVGGGAAAVAGNVGALTQAIKNKDIKGTIDAAKKAFEDIKNLTKKGKCDSKTLTANSPTSTTSNGSQSNAYSNNQQQSQQSNQGSAAQSDSYVCSGATMRCSMGTSQAKLTVLPIRTVYLTGQPMANISDHLTMVNLAPFGRCRSLGFPATASATAANYGSLTPMPCMHNTPFPWMQGKNDYLIKGDPALLKSSTCSCLWGGTISLITDGQTPAGLIDMNCKPIEVFPKNQPHCKSTTVQCLSMLMNHDEKKKLVDKSYGQKLLEDRSIKQNIINDDYLKEDVDTIIEKADNAGVNTIDCFWTDGGANYLNRLKELILEKRPEFTVNILEDTERGKKMMFKVNKRLDRYVREYGIDLNKYGINTEDLYRTDDNAWNIKKRIWNEIKESEEKKRDMLIDKYMGWEEGRANEIRTCQDSVQRIKNKKLLKSIWADMKKNGVCTDYFHTIVDVRDRYQDYISSIYAKDAGKKMSNSIIVVVRGKTPNKESIWNKTESKIIEELRGGKFWTEIQER